MIPASRILAIGFFVVLAASIAGEISSIVDNNRASSKESANRLEQQSLQQKNETGSVSNVPNPTGPIASPATAKSAPSTNSTGTTVSEVATHNTRDNCWLIISAKVYNVTNFIQNHPGGANAIVDRCGTDATTAFNVKGNGGHNHSASARALLPTYYVSEAIGAAPAVNYTPPASTNDDDWEDDD